MKKNSALILLLISIFSYGQKKETQEANNLYSKEKYSEAIVIFEKLLKNNYGTLTNENRYQIFINLANSYYELKNYAVCYEKWEETITFLKENHFKESDIKAIEDYIEGIKSEIPPIENSTTKNESSKNPLNTDTDKTVTLTVSGTGKSLEEARLNALRSAIEQAFGAFISSKTEILNDIVVADQIASVTNGNIQSFSVLNESQLPDGSWGLTLKALVSVSKLTSFVEAKGIVVEIKGSMFALNIKQQLLNEQGEIKAVCEMVGLLHEPMQTSFDYIIKSGDPKSIDVESKNWEIPLEVIATTNKNIDFCANYCIKTLAALSLSSEEVKSYQGLNKSVFAVEINYNGVKNTFYLRKQISINALKTLTSQWEFYARLFTVQSGMDESNGKGEGKIYDFYDKYGKVENINFLTAGQQAATFSWQDKRTLSQIEQMTGYTVKPRGVVSQFKYGGFVVYEKNGHGLVAAITNLGKLDWNSAKTACDELVLNGYSDWHLPTKNELNSLNENLTQFGIGGFIPYFGNYRYEYWSSNLVSNNKAFSLDFNWNNEDNFVRNFENGGLDGNEINNRYYVRAVRTF